MSYRITPRHSPANHATIPSGWITWRAAAQDLITLGLVEEQDFYLHHLGSGAALLMTSNSREGLELLALGSKALERLSALDVRVRVIDTLGDVYERDLQCIRPWWDPSSRP
ncbi:hypothetical protein [Streptomyces sp. B6B3]|uniref:hypothetical protein n=1 Tax=Streptomyces sp. B6B3 TaxID=3153570 RepID=UPI00325DEAFB